MPAPTRARRARTVTRDRCQHDGGAIEYASGAIVCDRCFARIDTPAKQADAEARG